VPPEQDILKVDLHHRKTASDSGSGRFICNGLPDCIGGLYVLFGAFDDSEQVQNE